MKREPGGSQPFQPTTPPRSPDPPMLSPQGLSNRSPRAEQVDSPRHLASRFWNSQRPLAKCFPSLSTLNFRLSTSCGLLLSAVSCELSAPLSGLECALPRFPPLTPLKCAVTKTPSCKSFRMRSYKKTRGEGTKSWGVQRCPSWFKDSQVEEVLSFHGSWSESWVTNPQSC